MYVRTARSGFSQAGFSLVEVSIVLVVIGLLIGSVLVAVNIMQNARITSTITTFQSIQSAVSTYNQNYGALPGDDKNAVTRLGVANSGGGDGVIGVSGGSAVTKTFDSIATPVNGNGETESRLIWSHLRAAGLIKGDKADLSQPGNPFGGIFGVQNGAFAANGIGLGSNVVCANSIPGAAAVIIDQRLDDGVATTGNVRASTSVTADAAAYADANTYVICMKVQ